MSYNYLASPYTHTFSDTMEERYLAALDAIDWLLKRHIWTYSPIVHCHNLAKRKDLPVSASYWASFNRTMLEPANTLLLLEIDGWRLSKGVKQEIAWAREMRIPITFLRPVGAKAPRYQLVSSTSFTAEGPVA